MSPLLRRLCALLPLALLAPLVGALLAAPAHAAEDDGPRLVGILDYLAADYPGAVVDGQVVDAFEYEEQISLVADARALLDGDDPAGLAPALAQLARLVDDKAPAAAVARAAADTRARVVAAYAVSLAPPLAPSLANGRSAYATHCASCHGAGAAGDGPAAAGMAPAPADFTDPGLRAGLSAYRVYNTATFGIDGTPMASFAHLPEGTRWDIAFAVMALAQGPGEAALPAAPPPTLAQLAGETDAALDAALVAAGVPDDRIDAARRGLRVAGPAALAAPPAPEAAPAPEALDAALASVAAARAAWADGQPAAARRHLLTGYLDHFEPLEARLALAAPDRVAAIERGFLEGRAAPDAASADPVLAALEVELAAAQDALADGGAPDAWATAAASALILLREGVEAALLVGLLLGLVSRTGGGAGARRWVLGGVGGALAAGGVTWVVATRLVAVSGQARELVEGLVGLLAAAVLLWVSASIRSPGRADGWLRFVRGQVQASVRSGRGLALAGVAFLAVYREAFETVLFYQALLLGAEGQEGAVLGGVFVAAVALLVAAVAVARLQARLPVARFFGASGWLLYAFAVVLVGGGLHALQEAGALPLVPVPGPTLAWLGVYPDAVGLGGQVALGVAAVAAAARRRSAAAT